MGQSAHQWGLLALLSPSFISAGSSGTRCIPSGRRAVQGNSLCPSSAHNISVDWVHPPAFLSVTKPIRLSLLLVISSPGSTCPQVLSPPPYSLIVQSPTQLQGVPTVPVSLLSQQCHCDLSAVIVSASSVLSWYGVFRVGASSSSSTWKLSGSRVLLPTVHLLNQRVGWGPAGSVFTSLPSEFDAHLFENQKFMRLLKNLMMCCFIFLFHMLICCFHNKIINPRHYPNLYFYCIVCNSLIYKLFQSIFTYFRTTSHLSFWLGIHGICRAVLNSSQPRKPIERLLLVQKAV